VQALSSHSSAGASAAPSGTAGVGLRRHRIDQLLWQPVRVVGLHHTGWLQDLTGSNRAAMFPDAGFMVLAGVIVLRLDRGAPRPVGGRH